MIQRFFMGWKTFNLALLVLSVFSCHETNFPKKLINAKVETQPVPSEYGLDAADDPAIWVNFSNPEKSLIIGTDKKSGLGVYDLDGRELSFYKCGEVNNVDVRYDFTLNDSMQIDLIVTNERIRNRILIFRLDTVMNSLIPLHESEGIATNLSEIYGLCMYAAENRLFVFVNDKSGVIHQFEIHQDNHKLNAQLVDSLKVETQPEGMVADDEMNVLYVGEEDRGIWKFPAFPSPGRKGELIISSTENVNPEIKYDIEGLAIYYAGNQSGYLIASSQGNNSYAIFERKTPNNFIGVFGIADGVIDGTEDTDGIEVTNHHLGVRFPHGVFIAQDGANTDGGKMSAQNFKLVDWSEIARLFSPPLMIDTVYRVGYGDLLSETDH